MKAIRGTLPTVLGLLLLSGLTAWGGSGSQAPGYATRPPLAEIAGTVRDAKGAPIPDAVVATDAGHRTRTAADGSYGLVIEAPGMFDVTARSDEGKTTLPAEAVLGLRVDLDLVIGSASLDDAVQTLKDAIAARVAAIGEPADKTRKKEAKGLGKAAKSLGKWLAPDKKGLGALGKAVKSVGKTGSADAGLAAAVSDILLACSAHAFDARTAAVKARDAVENEKKAGKITKLIEKADILAISAAAEPDAAAAAKLWGKTIATYDKARVKAEKLIAKQG